MNILKKSGELTLKQLYDLSKSPEIQKMSTVKGQDLEIDTFLAYEDVNTTTGEAQTIVSIRTTDGETFATNSKTFTREFMDVIAMCEEANAPMPKLIGVLARQSRAGREFITCAYKG